MARMHAVALGMALTAVGWPCCSVTFNKKGVVFNGQANIIVWDAETKTEHFVRQANFVTDAEDFGFIAPTPTVPELGISTTEIYAALKSLTPRSSSTGCSADRPAEGGEAAAASVEVIQVKDVGAYRATTLRADDAKALAKWMRTNKYATSKSIEEWTAFYIEKNWYLTAFKIRTGADQGAKTIPIRMSFKTEKPYNPYLVPKDNIGEGKGAGLSLFFVSKGSYRNEVPKTKHTLNARWREPLTQGVADRLQAGLGVHVEGLGAGWEVASYTDYEFPRQTSDDLYFSYVGASSWTWTPTRIAIDAVVLLAAGGAIVWWRRRRQSA